MKTLNRQYRYGNLIGTLIAVHAPKDLLGVGSADRQNFLGSLGELRLTPFITQIVPLDALEEIEENNPHASSEN